jgi:hypothetical protein
LEKTNLLLDDSLCNGEHVRFEDAAVKFMCGRDMIHVSPSNFALRAAGNLSTIWRLFAVDNRLADEIRFFFGGRSLWRLPPNHKSRDAR